MRWWWGSSIVMDRHNVLNACFVFSQLEYACQYYYTRVLIASRVLFMCCLYLCMFCYCLACLPWSVFLSCSFKRLCNFRFRHLSFHSHSIFFPPQCHTISFSSHSTHFSISFQKCRLTRPFPPHYPLPFPSSLLYQFQNPPLTPPTPLLAPSSSPS